MKLTETHREILEGRQVTGVCENYAWRWLLNGRPVTREVKTLLRHGLVEAIYFSGGKAAINPTESGRRAIS